MADVAEVKFQHIDESIEELKGKATEAVAVLTNHSERINDIEHWKNGKPERGAEERLQSVEEKSAALEKEKLPERMNCVEAGLEVVQRVADSRISAGVQSAVTTTLNARDRTFVAKLKAWGAIIGLALVFIWQLIDKFL